KKPRTWPSGSRTSNGSWASPSSWSSTTWGWCRRSPTGYWRWPTAACWPRAAPARCSRTRRWYGPIWGATSMPEPLLSVRNIETYYGPVMAIRGVSLDVQEGSIVTILGGNGAGKTTILKTISGAMDPQKGSIRFAGREISKRDPDWVARQGIAHVPEGREVFPFLTVRENLELGAYNRRDRAGIRRDLELVYEYFPVLRERADQQAAYLSGGQQQMLAIGRGLMAKPRLMLLDEPSLGLSPRLVTEIFDIIVRLNREHGVSMLLVEQNAVMGLKAGRYGYVLEVGRIVMENSCEQLMQSQDVQEFYLGIKDSGVRGQRRWKRRKTWR